MARASLATAGSTPALDLVPELRAPTPANYGPCAPTDADNCRGKAVRHCSLVRLLPAIELVPLHRPGNDARQCVGWEAWVGQAARPAQAAAAGSCAIISHASISPALSLSPMFIVSSATGGDGRVWSREAAAKTWKSA